MELLPFEYARKHRIVLQKDDNRVFLREDTASSALQEVQRSLGAAPALTILNEKQFEEKLQQAYAGIRDSSADVMETIKGDLDLQSVARDLEESGDLLDKDDDAPIIRLLNAVLTEALNEKASDIHIEPYQHEAAVRFRLDGVLRTVLEPSAAIFPLLISRIKVMSRLDISEKRLPQDGRMSVKLGGRNIDLRVSTMPSMYGERVVMRLLDQTATKLQIDDLGMSEIQKTTLHRLISRPHGMILVTGPTGSGKTTTLYAALQEMDRKEANVMTVEDPVEYDLPGISQTQINLRAGMTFAKGLKAILRQDPDVILIGEIRDGETAEIAVQSSLTGHLLLSTLHTNTATGAVTRMQDLGVDNFLLASTLRGVVAQRLVRKLCDHCKTPVEVDAANAGETGLAMGSTIYAKQGCDKCNWTGYAGRQGLYEIVEVTGDLQKSIHDGKGEGELESIIRASTPSILQEGYRMVSEGVTSLEEVYRVTTV
ncbi:MAG: type II secretion system ATPase GspE [bacterium]